MLIMTTYRIVRGTLSLGAAGTWGVQSGGVVFDYPASGWRAYLSGNEMVNMGPLYAECKLAVDLEGGGELRGVCSLIELDIRQAQVESGCQPDEFIEPTIIEAE
jgi:hypothetical protein